jgi:uncharacterized protein (TIGR02611 family)
MMVVWTLKKAKRLIITVIGFTVVAMGIAMMVLPGPAIVVIPIGLGVLATEYVWARRLLKHAKSHIARIRENMASRQRKPELHP